MKLNEKTFQKIVLNNLAFDTPEYEPFHKISEPINKIELFAGTIEGHIYWYLFDSKDSSNFILLKAFLLRMWCIFDFAGIDPLIGFQVFKDVL